MQELGVDVEWRMYNKDPFTKAELSKLIGKRPVSDFLNPRSPAYKKMGLKDKKITKTKAIELMLEDVNLFKRPLVVKGNTYIFGLDEAAYRKL